MSSKPCSSEIAHAEDYRQRHGSVTEYSGGQCIDCKEVCYSTRDVTHNGVTLPFCRGCRPFDRPCDCDKGECLPGTQECLACAIAEDLRPLIRARFARALFHVAKGMLFDKVFAGAEIERMM